MKSAYDPKSLHPYDVVRGVLSLDRAIPSFLEAEQYYHGDPKEVFGNSRVAADLEKNSHGFKVRFSKTPVDVMLNRMKVAGVKATDDDAATKLIAEIRKANDLAIWENEIHKNVFLYGSAYTLTWGIDDDDLDESAKVRKVGVKVGMQSVYSCRAVYDDLTQDAAYIIRSYKEGDRRVVEVYYNDGMIKWMASADDNDGHTHDDWILYPDIDDPEAHLVEYGVAGNPIHHFRNGFPYGRPEHRDAYEPQNAIIKYLTSGIVTSTLQTYKQRYTWTDPRIANAAPRDSGWDEEDNEGIINEDVSFNGDQVGSPGTIMDFQGVNGVGEFNESDPDVFLSPVEKYLSWMAQVTDTPAYNLNPGGEQPSGKARRIADEPLVKKVENRQLLIGGVWENLYTYALTILSVTVTEVVVKWLDASVADDDDVIDAILKKRALGIPDKELIMELGYTDEQADDFLARNASELGLDYKITKTAEAAEAIAKLKGVIPDEMLAIVATSLLGELIDITSMAIAPTVVTDVQTNDEVVVDPSVSSEDVIENEPLV